MKTIMPRVFEVNAHVYVAITSNASCSECPAFRSRVTNPGSPTFFSRSVLGNCGIETIFSSSFSEIPFRNPVDSDLVFHRKYNNPQIISGQHAFNPQCS